MGDLTTKTKRLRQVAKAIRGPGGKFQPKSTINSKPEDHGTRSAPVILTAIDAQGDISHNPAFPGGDPSATPTLCSHCLRWLKPTMVDAQVQTGEMTLKEKEEETLLTTEIGQLYEASNAVTDVVDAAVQICSSQTERDENTIPVPFCLSFHGCLFAPQAIHTAAFTILTGPGVSYYRAQRKRFTTRFYYDALAPCVDSVDQQHPSRPLVHIYACPAECDSILGLGTGNPQHVPLRHR